MVLQGGFKHVDASLSAELFLTHLADAAPEAHYFAAQPPPGIIMTAALDWRVVLPDRENLELVAAALWSGYDTLVKPLRTEAEGKEPALFIQIKNVRGECDQFTLGKDVVQRDPFLHRVRESAAVLAPKDAELAVRQELERTDGSDYWLRVGS